MNNFFDTTSSGGSASGIIVNMVFKLLFFIVIVFYVFYAFLLTLRVRILGDTVKLPRNSFVMALVYGHLVVVLVGSFLALILLLLA